jgi:AhpD family alkylhydroperoxidase
MSEGPIPTAMRDIVLTRDQNRCVRCVRYFADGLNLHHRQLRSQGGKNTAANLIALCGSGTTGCHGWVHAHPADARAVGLIVPSWADPAETPVRTWRGLVLLTDDVDDLVRRLAA